MDEAKKQEMLALLAQALFRETPDSIELGTAAKGGGLKVYGDFSKPDEFRAKLDNAMKLRKEYGAAAGSGGV